MQKCKNAKKPLHPNFSGKGKYKKSVRIFSLPRTLLPQALATPLHLEKGVHTKKISWEGKRVTYLLETSPKSPRQQGGGELFELSLLSQQQASQVLLSFPGFPNAAMVAKCYSHREKPSTSTGTSAFTLMTIIAVVWLLSKGRKHQKCEICRLTCSGCRLVLLSDKYAL